MVQPVQFSRMFGRAVYTTPPASPTPVSVVILAAKADRATAPENLKWFFVSKSRRITVHAALCPSQMLTCPWCSRVRSARELSSVTLTKPSLFEYTFLSAMGIQTGKQPCAGIPWL